MDFHSGYQLFHRWKNTKRPHSHGPAEEDGHLKVLLSQIQYLLTHNLGGYCTAHDDGTWNYPEAKTFKLWNLKKRHDPMF